MNEINIKLYNEKLIDRDIVSLTADNLTLITSLFSRALDAKNVKSKKELRKIASLRATESVIEELLGSPNGLTRGEMLGAADSENLSSVVLKTKNYLKKDNLYTLVKYTKNKEKRYRLDRI